MSFLCKIFRHRFETTFSVLTDHFPEVRTIRIDTVTHIGNDSFNYIRKCRGCLIEETNKVDLFGYTEWILLIEAKEIIKQIDKTKS